MTRQPAITAAQTLDLDSAVDLVETSATPAHLIAQPLAPKARTRPRRRLTATPVVSLVPRPRQHSGAETPEPSAATGTGRPNLQLVSDRGPNGGVATSFRQDALDLVFTAPQQFVPTLVSSTEATADLDIESSDLRRRLDAEVVSADDDEWAQRQPTGRSQLPDPNTWSRSYTQALVEVFTHRRHTRQIAKWTAHDVLEQLRHESPTVARRHRGTLTGPGRGRPAVVRSVRVAEPHDGVAEVSAVVQVDGRVRALALRLEGWDGRWICTLATLI